MGPTRRGFYTGLAAAGVLPRVAGCDAARFGPMLPTPSDAAAANAEIRGELAFTKILQPVIDVVEMKPPAAQFVAGASKNVPILVGGNHEYIKPAFGYRIDYKGHSVVLSGDTKYSKRVETEATGADLLIHEVAAVSGDAEQVLSRYPAYRTILDHHTDPQQAGALFAKARPKLAVYSHIVLPASPADGLPAATPAELVAQTRTRYDGPLVVGEDMMQFVLTDALVEMVNPKR